MTSESVGILSSPDRSSSPLITEETDYNFYTTIEMFADYSDVASQQTRSPGKRQLTIEESLFTTNNPKRLCNR